MDSTRPGGLDFVHYFDYLRTARDRLLGWVGDQDQDVYVQPFPFGWRSIRATLLHIAASEWGYTQRLAGRDVAPADAPFTPERQPEFEPFRTAWNRQSDTTRDVLSNLGDLERPVTYTSRLFGTRSRVRTTAGGIAAQLLFHEIHHRAQVMAMLRQMGVQAENLDYSVLGFEWTPLT